MPTPDKLREDGAEDIEPTIETYPGAVTRLEPPAPPDVSAGTEPKPKGRSNDETYRG